MNVIEIINEAVSEYVTNENIRNVLISKIPFLKEYNIFNNHNDNNKLEAQRVAYNKDVKVLMGDHVLNFSQYNISSEIYYYSRRINDYTFYNFIIENKFYFTQPKEIDDLTFRAFKFANEQLENKLSYHKEVDIKDGENFSMDQLDEIINEMLGILFKIEDFTNKHSISLF